MLVSRVGSPTSRCCQTRHACMHHGLRYPDSLTVHWWHYPAPLPLWLDFQNQLDLVLTFFRDWFWLYTTTFLVRFSQEMGFHPFWGIVQQIILSICMSITVSYTVNMKTAGLGFIFGRTICHNFLLSLASQILQRLDPYGRHWLSQWSWSRGIAFRNQTIF